MSTGDYLNDIPDNDTPFPSKASETECICARHTSDPLLIHVHDKCPMHGTESNGMNKTKISDDSTNLTPEDFSTWGFYCDSCKVFFDIQIDGAVHSSAEGIRYSHKCGSGARYISYDRRSVSETKIPDDLKNLNERVHDLSVGYSGREDVKRLIKLISSERAAVEVCEKELREENESLNAKLHGRDLQADLSVPYWEKEAALEVARKLFDALLAARAAKCEMNIEKRECPTIISEYKHLIPEFLKAMNEIGEYGEKKHSENSMQAALEKDNRTRPTERVQEYELQKHSRQHWQDYSNRMLHDHFGTLRHQLAAAAFNAMMEFFYASLDKER